LAGYIRSFTKENGSTMQNTMEIATGLLGSHGGLAALKNLMSVDLGDVTNLFSSSGLMNS